MKILALLFCAVLAFAQAPKAPPYINVSAATLGANTFTATQTFNAPSGNVGVVLQINGVFKGSSAYISGSNSMYFGPDGAAILGINILANGNTGIGTPNPLGFFSVGASSQFQVSGTGVATQPSSIMTAAAPTVAASQIGFGGTTAAASNCGSLAGATGCVVINVAGTTRYVPYY